ncbi:hypothetical protein C8J31_101793 [Rhizobium sp. PP-CC-2G-626]|nr:hypothetical protein C8J31_101793 [Rhizobium sp. PP-CC-2G-626]
MELVILQPGVWTLVEAHTAIQSKNSQSGIRIHYAEPVEEGEVEVPDVDTEAYFLVPDFATGPFRLPGSTSFSNGSVVYMMPDEAEPVAIVTY